jgi:hypothetical protein
MQQYLTKFSQYVLVVAINVALGIDISYNRIIEILKLKI